MDAGSAPLPAYVLDSWQLQKRWKCPRCSVKGVYMNGRSRICASGVHQWSSRTEKKVQ